MKLLVLQWLECLKEEQKVVLVIKIDHLIEWNPCSELVITIEHLDEWNEHY